MTTETITQALTLEIDRDLYIRAIRSGIDFDKALAEVLEAELTRIEAERPKLSDEKIRAFIEGHQEVLKRLADS